MRPVRKRDAGRRSGIAGLVSTGEVSQRLRGALIGDKPRLRGNPLPQVSSAASFGGSLLPHCPFATVSRFTRFTALD